MYSISNRTTKFCQKDVQGETSGSVGSPTDGVEENELRCSNYCTKRRSGNSWGPDQRWVRGIAVGSPQKHEGNCFCWWTLGSPNDTTISLENGNHEAPPRSWPQKYCRNHKKWGELSDTGILISAIQIQLERSWNVKVCHIFRVGNQCADQLAQLAMGRPLGEYLLTKTTPWYERAIESGCNGWNHPEKWCYKDP